MSKTCDEISEVLAEVRSLSDQLSGLTRELIEAVEKAVS